MSRWRPPSTLAGFECIDVHMTDLHSRMRGSRRVRRPGGLRRLLLRRCARRRLRLGPKSILFSDRLKAMFAAFFARPDTFALGVCNGCQMVSAAQVHHSRRRALAAFRRNLGAVRGALRHGRGAGLALRLLRRHAGLALCRLPWRTARDGPTFRTGDAAAAVAALPRCAMSTTGAPHRALPAQSQRLPRRSDRIHLRRRTGDHHDAAPRTRLPLPCSSPGGRCFF
jgi:hypothetical protein